LLCLAGWQDIAASAHNGPLEGYAIALRGPALTLAILRVNPIHLWAVTILPVSDFVVIHCGSLAFTENCAQIPFCKVSMT
jgi:hypothetical protein